MARVLSVALLLAPLLAVGDALLREKTLLKKGSSAKGLASAGKRQPDDGDDGYEYGDKEMSARDADSSDFSPEQFLTTDDGRDGPSATADLSAGAEAKREQVLASQDHFDSEDTPDTDDDFVQLSSHRSKAHRRHAGKFAKSAKKMRAGRRQPDDGDSDGYEYGDKEMSARDADSSDFSPEQFLANDDGRDAPSMTASLSAGDEQKRENVLASQDHFDSEDTPDTDDDFVQLASRAKRVSASAAAAVAKAAKTQKQHRRSPDDDTGDGYEYGDREMHARDADSSDYSAEQFIAADDGRDPVSMTADLSPEAEAKRETVMASQDHFDSEDTPAQDEEDFMQLAAKKSRAAAAGKAKRRSPWGEGSVDGYEYGDREMHARDADSSDFSAQQFLTPDDGRDAPSMTANLSPEAEAKREHIMASQDHFDSEDTPGPDDDFVQVAAARRLRRGAAKH